MEIPERLRKRLGDEEIESTVDLGGEDVICFTPTRTLLYHGEGILSDESVDVFDHNVERLDISSGRRKTSFTLEYVDRAESFSVPSGRGEAVLEELLGSILTAADIIDADEKIEGVYQFSELTLLLTDSRLVKHIGSYVWDEDFQEFPYEDVTGLEFEEGSVATSIVLSVDGRPQRIKAPNDEAPLLRRTLTETLCEFHNVSSLAALNEKLGVDEETEETGSVADDISLDGSITPLVGGDEPDQDTPDGTPENSSPAPEDSVAGGTNSAQTSAGGTPSADSVDDPLQVDNQMSTGEDDNLSTTEPAVDSEDIEAIEAQLATLTEAVKRQNKHLKRQQKTMERLVEELSQQE